MKKIVLFLIIFFFLFALTDFALAGKCSNDADCGAGAKCVEGKCVRALEITYPKIAGEELTEEVIAKEGVPGYVKYLFRLAVIIIGFIIFGVLTSSGLRYLTSAGNLEQMKDAKNGIFAAFFGGLLLLASVLIFNTINPQLTILELPKVEPLGQVVEPGIYICSYNVNDALNKGDVKIDDTPITDYNDIDEILKDYINEGKYDPKTPEGEEQIEKQNRAAKVLRAIMKLDNGRFCPKVIFSGNFENFKKGITANETIFIVPLIETIIHQDGRKEKKAKYEFGIVLHEKDNFWGKCDYFPKEKKVNGLSTIYHQIDGYSAQNLAFTAHSVTLFQKPPVEPFGDGVTLYKYFNYNRDATTTTSEDQNNFKPETGDILKVNTLGTLENNSRSISFSPSGSYLALLFENKDFDQRCQLLYKNSPNLFDILPTTGGCKTEFFGKITDLITLKWGECKPLLGSMIVIKGSVK
mgnify:CR=1 FL=1